MYPELSDETLTTVIGAANECARML
jgi:hypothetical protein